MGKKKYTIQIPKPCTESWQKMTAHDKGNFCARCQKHVFDFTNLSDDEIIRQIEAAGNDGMCGRFLNTQVDRELVPIIVPQQNFFLPKVLAGMMAIAAISPNIAAAQGQPNLPAITTPFNKSSAAPSQEFAPGALNKTFSGVVIDSVTNKPLKNINVWLENTNLNSYTNAKGEFSITVPDSFFISNQEIVLHLEWKIYPTKSYTFHSYNLPKFRLLVLDKSKAMVEKEVLMGRFGSYLPAKDELKSPKRIFPMQSKPLK